MARARQKRSRGPFGGILDGPARLARGLVRWTLRLAVALVLLVVAVTVAYRWINPPITHTMIAEWRRLGAIERDWVAMEAIAPAMARSVVAAEDANFCRHWGFDVDAIRLAIAEGRGRGASTITQQVVKNVYLWQGRSWVRKALETAITPLVEMAWPKRRILEIYLNVAETGNGIFGIEAAAQGFFDVPAAELSATQAARIAAVLPNPRSRSATDPGPRLRARGDAIRDGAATIARDGRAACFETG